MGGLRLKFNDLNNETRALKTIAKDFLDPATTWVLDRLESDLKSIWSAKKETKFTLKLQELRTRPSEGDYEIGSRKGALSVYAAITGAWDVRPLGDYSNKGRTRRLLEFCGKSSTKVELHDIEDGTPRVAMWRMELGAEEAPGCYFHIQILGDSDDRPFPRNLPIPRFPSMFITPMVGIEYVLGELFQDKWHKAVARDVADVTRWRELQRRRLHCLLDWHKKQLDNVISSPWMTLKVAKPDGDMFLK